MLVLIVVLVVCATVAKAHLARQSRLAQKLERAINSGLADGRVFFLHEPIKVFAGEMLLRAQKDIQDQVALRRALQASLLQVLKKYFLLFTHMLSICRSLRVTGSAIF